MPKRTKRGRRVNAHVTANPNPPTFCIEFVLDETGSMGCVRDQTVAGYNDYVDEQRGQPGACKLSLTKFEGGKLYQPFEDIDIALVPTMTDRMFCPLGGTNLFDAIGERIEALAERLSRWTEQPNVLFVVMTDGADNQSQYFNAAMIAALVSQYRERGWAFAYLGADNRNALRIGRELGFRDDEIKCFAQAQIRETMRDLSAATTVYRTAAATGTQTTIFK